MAGGKDTRIVESGPEPKLTISSPEKATLRRLKLGVLGEMMVVETSAAMTPKLTTTVIVWNDVKRIDITNHLTKTRTYDKEAAYFAFPFAAEKPTFRYEVPAGIVTANTDMLPGACLDWFTVQHFVEVAGRQGRGDLGHARRPAGLLPGHQPRQVADETRFHQRPPVRLRDEQLLVHELPGGPGRRLRVPLRLDQPPAGRQRGVRPVRLERLEPAGRRRVRRRTPAGTLPAEPTSLVSVAEPNVMLVGAKRPDGGAGLILRLWEISGQATTAHVRLSQSAAQKATACNLVEEPAGPLEIRDGTIAVPIRARGLATVRVE